MERVFRLLAPRDLRVVVLVCHRWREVAEAPALWAWVCLAVHSTNLSYMPGLLRGRLLGVREMRARVVSEELLQVVASHPALRSLDVSDATVGGSLTSGSDESLHLQHLEPSLLASAITGLTKLSIWETHLTTEQTEALFARMTVTHQLRSLDISYNDLSGVKPSLLARAAMELEELRVRGTSLTPAQGEALFTALDEGESRLETLHLSYCNLATLDPSLFARVVCGLREVAVMYCSLTPSQLQTLFHSVRQGSSLTAVDLSHNDLSSVDPEILAEAVNKLETVALNRTCVTCEQVTSGITIVWMIDFQ